MAEDIVIDEAGEISPEDLNDIMIDLDIFGTAVIQGNKRVEPKDFLPEEIKRDMVDISLMGKE